jgi:hypothetical protein
MQSIILANFDSRKTINFGVARPALQWNNRGSVNANLALRKEGDFQ